MVDAGRDDGVTSELVGGTAAKLTTSSSLWCCGGDLEDDEAAVPLFPSSSPMAGPSLHYRISIRRCTRRRVNAKPPRL